MVSIMNSVGACGLQLYNFGQTVSLVFFTDTWQPDRGEPHPVHFFTLRPVGWPFLCERIVLSAVVQEAKDLRTTVVHVHPAGRGTARPS
jgi:hypothetical protein